MTSPRRKTFLAFSQTFVPDPASVGQHMTDVCIEMARRGHRVLVYTARRGYENPKLVYPAHELHRGVEIRRLAFSSFGKKNLLIRAFGTFTFMIQCVFLALFTRNISGIFFSTSPPLIGVAAGLAHIIRRVPIAYWAMDLNPDQLIAMGKISATSFTARVLERINRFILNQSALVIALDRFMAERLKARGVKEAKMLVMPPWPHEDHMEVSDRAQNPFRQRHGLEGKFVVMYSGNHSPANPLKTLLDSAVRLKEDASLRFLFVGGGSGKAEVERCIREHGLSNAVSLPYQPLAGLGDSLGAADVHVVSLGQEMVGIVHPCKIYGAMAVARPVLFFGPSPSHVSDLLEAHDIGWHVAHGDVEGAIRAIGLARASSSEKLTEMGARARELLQGGINQRMLCGRLCDHLEKMLCAKTHGPVVAAKRSEKEMSCVV
jgi:colanic acid biosynthesis glycosyl transferase WcaI